LHPLGLLSLKDKKRDKLVLMSWCPDDVKVRSKFIHAASVEGMKKAITGISAFVQVSVHPVEICDPTYAVQHN
jgi:hypothetical protein